LPNLRDFLTETLSKLQNGVEQKIYTVDVSEDVTNVIQQLAVMLAEYFVSCWLSPMYGNQDEIWEKWNTSLHPDRTDMLDQLQNAFCDKNGEVADHPDPKLGLTKAKGNFAETLLRWIEETFRDGEKRFIPSSPQPSDQGRIDLVEVILPQEGDWFAILWESKATEDNISSVAFNAYEQLDDYPTRAPYLINDRAASLKEDGIGDGRYALVLRSMPALIKQRSPKIHYGLFITHDAAARQPYLRDLPNRPPNVPIGCHHLTFVALPNFADLRDAVWRKMELK